MYFGLFSEVLRTSSKVEPAELAYPPNSNVDKCASPAFGADFDIDSSEESEISDGSTNATFLRMLLQFNI